MIRTPFKGRQLSMALAMLDGNGMCKEVVDSFCQSNPQLQILAIFITALRSLPLAFNTSFDILVLRGCALLVDIGGIRELPNLSVLEISGASSLREMPHDIFKNMTKLQSLHLSSLQVKKLPTSFYQLAELQRLLLKDCPNLDELRCLAKCDSLVVLNLSGATSLKQFPYKKLERMQKLRTLDISNTDISEIRKFGKMEQLTHISFRDCPRVNRLPSIASLPRLQVLDISGAKEFIEIHDVSLENPALDILDLSGTQIRKLPSIFGNPRRLTLKGCSSLKKNFH